MPNKPVPTSSSGVPLTEDLPVGKILWRIHRSRFHSTEFNQQPVTNPYAGGRFDSVAGDYSYLYAGDSVHGAVVETLLRDIPLANAGEPRVLPGVALKGRLLSRVVVARPIKLVSLHGPGLSMIGQDGWLTNCDAMDYVFTRTWAQAIRGWVPNAAGFAWRSRLDDSRLSYVFFGDVLTADSLVKAGKSMRCPQGPAKAYLEPVLESYQVRLST